MDTHKTTHSISMHSNFEKIHTILLWIFYIRAFYFKLDFSSDVHLIFCAIFNFGSTNMVSNKL